jgi:hypothetical protein
MARSSSCSVCPAGSYSAGAGASACMTCPAGRYNDDDATSASEHNSITTCSECEPGKYIEDEAENLSRHNDAVDCLSCMYNTFAAERGSAMCEECPTGKSSSPGASVCGECPTGYECKEGKTTPCSTGKFSNGGSACLDCEEGYKYVVQYRFSLFPLIPLNSAGAPVRRIAPHARQVPSKMSARRELASRVQRARTRVPKAPLYATSVLPAISVLRPQQRR